MVFVNIFEIDIKIVKFLRNDFGSITKLFLLNKASYQLINKTTIFCELKKIKLNHPNSKFDFNIKGTLKMCFELHLNELIKIIFKYDHDSMKNAIRKNTEFDNNPKFYESLEYCNYNILLHWSLMYCNIEFFKWFSKQGHYFKNIVIAINIAAEYGNIKMLEWFKNNFPNFEYQHDAVNSAAANGHIHVLEWFKNLNQEFKYSEDAIDNACKNGHINVLEWFCESGLQLKYTGQARIYAIDRGHLEILKWFKKQGHCFDYLFTIAVILGHFEIFKWLASNYSISKYLGRIIQIATKNNNIEVLDWIKNKGYDKIRNINVRTRKFK